MFPFKSVLIIVSLYCVSVASSHPRKLADAEALKRADLAGYRTDADLTRLKRFNAPRKGSGNRQRVSDDDLTIQIEKAEKADIDDGWDMMVNYETDKSGNNLEAKSTFADFKSTTENQRVAINSNKYGGATGTVTNLGPKLDRRKARAVGDDDIIIERLVLNRRNTGNRRHRDRRRTRLKERRSKSRKNMQKAARTRRRRAKKVLRSPLKERRRKMSNRRRGSSTTRRSLGSSQNRRTGGIRLARKWLNIERKGRNLKRTRMSASKKTFRSKGRKTFDVGRHRRTMGSRVGRRRSKVDDRQRKKFNKITKTGIKYSGEKFGKSDKVTVAQKRSTKGQRRTVFVGRRSNAEVRSRNANKRHEKTSVGERTKRHRKALMHRNKSLLGTRTRRGKHDRRRKRKWIQAKKRDETAREEEKEKDEMAENIKVKSDDIADANKHVEESTALQQLTAIDARSPDADELAILEKNSEEKAKSYERLLQKSDVADFFGAELNWSDLTRVYRETDDDDTAADVSSHVNKRPSELELDADDEFLESTNDDINEESNVVERDADGAPNWMKDTKKMANPMTLQEGVMRELKVLDPSNAMFQKFSDNPAATVPWKEPTMLSNCWIQLMLSDRYSFAPSCNEDGTFLAKQCFLERCWCVNLEGKPTALTSASRFYFKDDGVQLTCAELVARTTTTRQPTGVQVDAANIRDDWPDRIVNENDVVLMSKLTAKQLNIPIQLRSE